jgi:hypothetical protein
LCGVLGDKVSLYKAEAVGCDALFAGDSGFFFCVVRSVLNFVFQHLPTTAGSISFNRRDTSQILSEGVIGVGEVRLLHLSDFASLTVAFLAPWRLKRTRFLLHRPAVTSGVISISASQLAYMLDGIDWRNPQHTWRPTAAG